MSTVDTGTTDPVETRRGKQKLWVSAIFAAAITVLQILAGDAGYAGWATVALALMGTLGVYVLPNKPYVNP